MMQASWNILKANLPTDGYIIMKRGLAHISLALNSAFSALTGIISLALAGPLAGALFSTPERWAVWSLRGLGIGLLLFSLRLFFLSRNTRLSRSDVMRVVIADILWVILSAALLLGFSQLFTDLGVLTVTLIAAIVALFALGQYVGATRIIAKTE